MQDISISRKLRNLMRTFKKQPKSIIILASEVDIPPELADLITVVEFSLPNAIEIRNELIRLFDTLKQPFEEDSLDLLVRSCQGLSLERIRRALSKSIAQYSTIDNRTIDLILNEKRQIIGQTQILEFQTTTVKFDDIGG